MIGFLDRIEEDVFLGWACDSKDKNTKIEIEIIDENGKNIGKSIANLPRKDLADAGYGDCAFSIKAINSFQKFTIIAKNIKSGESKILTSSKKQILQIKETNFKPIISKTKTYSTNIAFIIGPSAVGKTTLVNSIKNEKIKCLSLDCEIIELFGETYNTNDIGDIYKKVGHECFILLSLYTIFSILKNIDKNLFYLIDVGSGSISKIMSNLSIFGKVIYLSLPLEQLYKRFITKDIEMSAEQYYLYTFSDGKHETYMSADIILNTYSLEHQSIQELLLTSLELQEKETPLNYLTNELFTEIALNIGGEHWKNFQNRWLYHKISVQIIKYLEIQNNKKILEIGTMGMQLISGSVTMDYNATKNNASWFIDGFKPDILHDARNCPYPFAYKEFDLVVALRVFHHLKPYQKEALKELKRIANNILIVTPNKLNEIILWNEGVQPTLSIKVGDFGFLYFFKDEQITN